MYEYLTRAYVRDDVFSLVGLSLMRHIWDYDILVFLCSLPESQSSMRGRAMHACPTKFEPIETIFARMQKVVCRYTISDFFGDCRSLNTMCISYTYI